MAGKKRRPANDRAFKKYKLNNQRLKNKIRKMERHCKRHPNDEEGKKNLERIKKDGIADKKPSRNPGTNKQPVSVTKYLHFPGVKTCNRTAGEQLSELLGIPMPEKKSRKRRKPKIIRKKTRNVKTQRVSKTVQS